MAQAPPSGPPRKTTTLKQFSTMASQNERFNTKPDEFFWLENIMRVAPHKLHSVPGPRSITTYPIPVVSCPDAEPGPQSLPTVCCYDVSSGFGDVGVNHHGMFAHADADGTFWFTVSTASGFSSGPYPNATPSRSWYVLNGFPNCSYAEGTPLLLPGAATANFQSTQTPQGGTCGKSDEKCYLLVLSNISPPVWPINGSGFIGFPGATTAVVFFGESTGVHYLFSSFNGGISFNAWCKFGNYFYSVNGGASPNLFARWPLNTFDGTYEDLNVHISDMLPGWNDGTFSQSDSFTQIHATSGFLYILAHGPWSGGPDTYRIFKINRSNLTYVTHWDLSADPNFPQPWGLHAFSDSLLFLAKGTQNIAGVTVGNFHTASGTTAVIGTDGGLCTNAGNAIGAPSQSGFYYSKNYFYLSYSGYGLGNTNVKKIGPLVCPSNPTIPWEN